MGKEVGARRLLTFSMAAVLALLVAMPSAAQTDVTTSRISGTVRDQDGGALPGATVEATNQETGLVLRAVTDANGSFRIFNMPTGVYTVSASLPGFKTSTRSDVRLVLGSAPTVDFILQIEGFAEAITVTSEAPLVEVTNTVTGTTVLTEQIASLPVSGRDFENLVYLTPESRKESQRGYISLSGQRGIATNVTIDGVDNNNAFFGGTTGDAEGRAPLAISQEVIKEFSVITNGAPAEFGRSGGGFVNVITKSGTNQFRGSVFYYNQPQSLVADPPVGQLNDQKKAQYGFSLGGPFIKDRLFFFTAFDNQKQDETVVINPIVLDAEVFAKYPVLRTDPEYVRTNDGRVAFGRLDYFATPSHRFMARINYSDYEGVNGTSASPTRAESYNGIETMWSRSTVVSYSGVFGNLINDLNLQYAQEDIPRRDKGLNLPDIQVRNLGNYGEVSFLPIDPTQTERKTIGDTLTYMLGNHVLKGGFEYNDTNVNQVFKGNWRGVYIFNSKADFLAGRWSEYRQFGGLGGLTADEAGRSAFGQKELAFFVQDQWYLSPRVTASLGLRWESLDNPDFGILNPNDRNPDGSFKLTGRIPDDKKQWSPRLGITYQAFDKSVFRFTAGRFFARTPALLWAQTNTSNGYRGTQYLIRAGSSGPTDPLSPPWGATWDPQRGFRYIDFSRLTTIPAPGVFTVDPNFRNSYTDRVTLEFDYELFANTVLSLAATYAESKYLQRLTDFNLQYQCADGTVGLNCTPAKAANGMPRYASARPYPYYGRINMYMTDARAEYQALTMLLQRRFVERFFGFLSVTYSKDKDTDSNERNFSGLFVEDKRDIENNWGYSDRDQRWKISANGTWNTPWWGIAFSGLFRYATGQPYTAFVGSDLNNDGDSGTDRPTVGGVHFARNSFRQPNYWGLDLRLQKKFELGPGGLAVIAECFNCTDREDWRVTSTTWGTAETPRSDFGNKSYVGTPRTFQLALRYDF
ncbi:MAG: TonB-dependent receptor [Acidobacteriota bacterium]